MGSLIQRADLEAAISKQTVLSLFDDGTNVVDDSAVNLCIESAEAEVMSFLVGDYPNPLPDTIDPLLKRCALDFAIVMAYERKPEYGRFNGEDGKRPERWTRAVERMERIQAAVQQPPVLVKVAPPANVGGVVVDNGVRICTASPDGTDNGSGF